jgi:hypothetical protein
MSSLFCGSFYRFLLSSLCFLNAFQLNFFVPFESDDPYFVQQSHDLEGRVNFMPPDASEVGAGSVLMVIVVITFSHHQKING